MYFEYPKLLWLMVVPALMVLHYLWLELAKRHPHLRVSTATPWLVKRTPFMAVLRHVPFVLRTFALAMIVVAIARPRSSEQMEKIDEESDLIIYASYLMPHAPMGGSSFFGDDTVAHDLGKVTDSAQETVGDTGCTTAAGCDLHSTSRFDRHA